MTKAIITSFHCYTPFGRKFYQPIEDYFFESLMDYQDEFDKVYVLDSQWNIEWTLPEWGVIIKSDPSRRYYDAYKKIISQGKVKEDAVLFLDNDFIIYKPGTIKEAFNELETKDIVSIYDTCGTYKTDKLNGKNKFCPYFFATKSDRLKLYLDIDWGPNMPEYETLGLLTKEMLDDDLIPYEMQEDKSDFLFGEELKDRRSLNLGYYHIRAGSTPAYLLSHRERGDSQYFDYIKNQPKSEYLRQFAWYWIIGGSKFMDKDLLTELGANYGDWLRYVEEFRIFHGLK